jgi:glycerol-3-phosphate acyltransferase PlsY
MAIIWIGVAYLIGSIPFGLVLAKTFCRIDPRAEGSGNIGSTNIARLCGKGWGAATLACDIMKGTLPVLAALHLGDNSLVHSLTALAAILGHLHSCFLGFKGGKAVATSIGVLLPLAFVPLLCASLLCILVIWRSGFVSLGSLTLVSALPLLLMAALRFDLLPLALVVMIIVYWSHRENIRRLAWGEEKSWLKKQ